MLSCREPTPAGPHLCPAIVRQVTRNSLSLHRPFIKQLNSLRCSSDKQKPAGLFFTSSRLPSIWFPITFGAIRAVVLEGVACYHMQCLSRQRILEADGGCVRREIATTYSNKGAILATTLMKSPSPAAKRQASKTQQWTVPHTHQTVPTTKALQHNTTNSSLVYADTVIRRG